MARESRIGDEIDPAWNLQVFLGIRKDLLLIGSAQMSSASH